MTKAETLVTYTPKEMIARAWRKVDLSGLIRNADLKGTAKIDLFIGTSGNVVCLNVESTHPFIKVSVGRALSSWIFRQERPNGKPVA